MNLRSIAKDLTVQVLCAIGVPRSARRNLRGELAILMFHGVEPRPLSPSCPQIVDSATFRRQLQFVRRNFAVLPLGEALERLDAGTLPDRAATLTFDDGTRNLATVVAPLLRELGLPAAMFLATGPMGTSEVLWPDRLWLGFAQTDRQEIDLAAFGLGLHPLRSPDDRFEAWRAVIAQLKAQPDSSRIESVDSILDILMPNSDVDAGPFEMLSWDEARTLADDPLIDLYPHSVTHPILSRCTDDKVDYEITESCRTLEREIGQKSEIFAYPNGHPDDFDDRAIKALQDNGIRWSLATTMGFASKDSDPFRLPRIGVGLDQSYALFRLRVSGAIPLHRLRTGRGR